MLLFIHTTCCPFTSCSLWRSICAQMHVPANLLNRATVTEWLTLGSFGQWFVSRLPVNETVGPALSVTVICSKNCRDYVTLHQHIPGRCGLVAIIAMDERYAHSALPLLVSCLSWAARSVGTSMLCTAPNLPKRYRSHAWAEMFLMWRAPIFSAFWVELGS